MCSWRDGLIQPGDWAGGIYRIIARYEHMRLCAAVFCAYSWVTKVAQRQLHQATVKHSTWDG